MLNYKFHGNQSIIFLRKGRPGSEWLKVVSYQKTGDKKQSESCDDNLEKLIFQDQQRIMLEIKRF